MYAIIADGGRQYRVEEGQQLAVDYRDIAKGEVCRFERVLAVTNDSGTTLGLPVIEGAVVTAEVLGVVQADKIYIQKFRRRKTYRRRTGHRQMYTNVKITKIEGV
ncbi:50S ribosomal protein L21 [Lignipirellula cremea]|uniref:Large ribosomal subunit protein bL21 n=1 Tax=Lignipirellula cremea TaxID=2528010 RepID=A0A518DTW3_9BACT|nr:50S ribosomal protein L21 [Lignipirellula cremea]QDU95269.1 50S ribosomal protein L21 [Lignipirellula cremea]